MWRVRALGSTFLGFSMLWIPTAPRAEGREPAQNEEGSEALDASNTPALEYVNSELPSWLKLSGALRFRFENRQGLGYLEDNDDGYALFRTRLNVDIQPTEWLQFFVQGQDARAPKLRPEASEALFRDPADLRQAYVRIGQADSVWLTVGRQLLDFGDQRLIGPLDWSNTARSWEAVRLELKPLEDLKIDLFASSVVSIDPSVQINHPTDGVNLHGIHGVLTGVIPDSTVETFVLWRTGRNVFGETGGKGTLNRYSAGTRIAAIDGTDFDYSLTFVSQWGTLASSDIKAWAYSLSLGRTLGLATNPRIFIEYNFASGDKDPGDGTIGWFDDVYPTAHPYYGQIDLVGWRNIKNLRIGTALRFLTRLQVSADYHAFWLHSTRDNLYNTGGAITVAPPPGGARDSKVGDEIDVTLSVPVTSTVSFGGGVGRMFPGPFLEAHSPGGSNTFAFVFSNTRF